jgi:hypothetical protein
MLFEMQYIQQNIKKKKLHKKINEIDEVVDDEENILHPKKWINTDLQKI